MKFSVYLNRHVFVMFRQSFPVHVNIAFLLLSEHEIVALLYHTSSMYDQLDCTVVIQVQVVLRCLISLRQSVHKHKYLHVRSQCIDSRDVT